MRNPGLLIKRFYDIFISASALVLLSPLMLAVAVIVRLNSPGQAVFFLQARPGYHGKHFVLYKFRTMTDERDKIGNLLPDKLRLKRWGLFLRRYSLDELPQFFNILKGDMSLIGPRPLLIKYLELYTPEQMHRHDMKPGLSGLTAVLGRNSLGWDERFYYDNWYIDHWSLMLDLKIACKTIYTAFFSKKGIEGYEISKEFEGGKDAPSVVDERLGLK